MSRTYLVHLPRAEARHLAGQGPACLPTPESRCLAAVREWLCGINRGRGASVPVATIVADLTLILEQAPASVTPSRGPFGPGQPGPPPGRVQYLGGGTVRLDEAAISSLAALPPGDDFRVILTDAGPVLTLGTDNYYAREEEAAPP